METICSPAVFQEAQRVMRLRNALVNMTNECVQDVFEFIQSENGFDNIESFICNFADCLRARPFQVNAFIQLINMLAVAFPEAAQVVKNGILHELVPVTKWAVAHHDFWLVLMLTDSGFFSEDDVVSHIKQIWKSRDHGGFDYCLMLYLMPILERHIPEKLEYVTDYFLRMAAYDDVPPDCDDFSDEDYMQEFKANNYALQQQLARNGHNGNPVIEALMEDDVAALQQLTSTPGFNIQEWMRTKWYMLYDGNTYAEIAAFFGSIQCLRLLLSLGAPYNKPAMARCIAASGNLEMLEMFADQDLPLDAAFDSAIRYENLHIIDYLLERGVESTNAMHTACHRGCLAVFLKLLERGQTAGIEICPCGHVPRDILEFIFNCHNPKQLLSQSRDVWTQVAGIGNVSHFMALARCDGEIPGEILGKMLLAAARSGKIDMFNCLITAGAPVDQITINGETILHCAVQSGSLELVDLILSAGLVDVNAVECNNRTALHMAANGSSRILQRLIAQEGVNFTLGDESGETAIMMATNSTRKFLMLLETGKCNPMQRNWEENTLAHLCVFPDNPEILAAMISYDGVDWTAENADGNTPYDIAVKYEYPRMAEMLEQASLNNVGSGMTVEEREA